MAKSKLPRIILFDQFKLANSSTTKFNNKLNKAKLCSNYNYHKPRCQIPKRQNFAKFVEILNYCDFIQNPTFSKNWIDRIVSHLTKCLLRLYLESFKHVWFRWGDHIKIVWSCSDGVNTHGFITRLFAKRVLLITPCGTQLIKQLSNFKST